jgi:hypothetical protein
MSSADGSRWPGLRMLNGTFLGTMSLSLLACASGEPSTCDGFDDRQLGITGEEYRPCAGEILATLDSLEPQLQALVAGGDAAPDEDARDHYRALKEHLRRTGIEADYRSFESSTVIVKWPDGATRQFNRAAFEAAVQYGAVLAYPNDDNLGQGVKAHEEARRAYGQIQ